MFIELRSRETKEMQLNLFNWHLIVAGRGFKSLSLLNFEDSRKHFSEVLRSLPDHPEASRGMRELAFWQNTFDDISKLDAKSAPSLFWKRINEFSFANSDYSQILWQNVIRYLKFLLKGAPTFYEPPDLCTGYLDLLLGDYAAAERHLKFLLNGKKSNGLLHFFLAEAISLQGQMEKSGPYYAKALLLSPSGISGRKVSFSRLSRIIQDYGAALAPIYGYFEGILPLVETDCVTDSPECKTYAVLRRVELTRHSGDHNSMVAARKEMKIMAPGLFQVYLDWLENKQFLMRK